MGGKVKMPEAVMPEIVEPLPEIQHSIRPGMNPTLTVAMVSPILEPGNKSANLDKFISYVRDAAAKGAEVVIFPEAALTGYELSKPPGYDRPLGQVYEWAETIPGPSVQRLIAAAKDHNVYIVMGMFEADTEYVGRVYNSSAFVGPEGLLGRYRKNSLCNFGMFSGSQWGLDRGFDIPVWEIKQGWRVAINICYDFWFPEVPRVAVVKGADLLLVISFNPCRWEETWHRLVLVRAIENQTGVAWTNAAGTYYAPYLPKEGVTIGGSRMAVEASGSVLVEEQNSDVEGMSLATFTAEGLYRARGATPTLRDRNPVAYRALAEPRELVRDVVPYKGRLG